MVESFDQRRRVAQCPVPPGHPPPGHFPTDQSALKCLYLTLRSLDPTGRGRQRWAIRWKPALNAFALMFEGRIIPDE